MPATASTGSPRLTGKVFRSSRASIAIMAHRSNPVGATILHMVSEQEVRTALVAVIDPEIRRSVVELDMVRAVAIEGSDVEVTIALTVPGCPMKANLEQQVREHVGAVDGRRVGGGGVRRDDRGAAHGAAAAAVGDA